MPQPHDDLTEIASLVAEAERILFITGAGISADSGLPTYRGVGGLYEEELTDDGISIEDALSGEMLRRHPEITWKYLAQIEHNCRGAKPNAAHTCIADLERLVPAVTVFTQNIDGLHRDAGSTDIIEVHGCMRHLHCTRCRYETQVPDYAGLAIPPRCPECGAPVRPQVVFFGEALPEEAMARLVDTLEAGPDLVFSVGTSSLFPYIAEPVVWARQQGIPTVEINPGRTPLSPLVHFQIPLGAADALGQLRHLLGQALD